MVMWADFIKNCLRMRDDLWFYVLLPKGYENYEFVESLPKTTLVVEERKRRRFFEEIDMVDMDTVYRLFNMRTGIYPIDAVITEKTGIALLMQKLISDIRYAKEEDYVKVPVVIVEDRAWSRTKGHQFVDWQEFALRALSYSCLRSVVLTSFEKDEVIDASKQYVSPALLRRLKENVTVINLGIPLENVDRAVKGVKKREKFTLFWGGRLSAQKRPFFVLEQFLKMFEGGRDVDIVVTTPHVASIKFAKKLDEYMRRYSGLKIMFDVGRDEYLRLCASSHVWMSASLHEGFSVGMCEMMATGVPGIVPRRPWSVEMLGEDYELFYDPRSFEEAATLLRWVYENYDEAVEIGRRTRERVIKKFDNRMFADMLLARVEEEVLRNRSLVEKFIVNESSKVGQTVVMLADRFEKMGIDEFSLHELAYEFKKFSYGGISFDDGARMQDPSLWDIRQFLMSMGYVDLCDSEVPRFRREET